MSPVDLPPLGEDLYEFYPAMSAQTHEDAVKAYARRTLAAKDAALAEMRVELAEARAYQEAFMAENEVNKGRLEQARKALAPFAKYMESGSFDLDNKGEPLPDDRGVGWVYLTIGDFRNAARALGPSLLDEGVKRG